MNSLHYMDFSVCSNKELVGEGSYKMEMDRRATVKAKNFFHFTDGPEGKKTVMSLMEDKPNKKLYEDL